MRLQAVRMYVDGMNLRHIAGHLGVNHQSVANWVKAYAAQLPPAPVPDAVEVIEMDTNCIPLSSTKKLWWQNRLDKESDQA